MTARRTRRSTKSAMVAAANEPLEFLDGEPEPVHVRREGPAPRPIDRGTGAKRPSRKRPKG